MRLNLRGLVVVGNDTEVGKTTLACQLIQQLNAHRHQVGVFKPAASGYDDTSADSDFARLIAAAGRPYPVEDVCPYRFEKPVAPLLAARELGTDLSDERIDACLHAWQNRCEVLVVETAGGLMSPLSKERHNLQFAKQTGLPVLVVIANRLGAINQANLVCSAIHLQGIPILAVLFNQVELGCVELLQSNVAMFEEFYEQNFQAPAPPCYSVELHGYLSAEFITEIERQLFQ